MRHSLTTVAILVMLGAGAALLAIQLIDAGAESDGESIATVALGRALYAEQCASCHGANLEGQPDWKSRLPSGRLPAPPHDASGHTWHHGDDALFRITKEGPDAVIGGDYESDMPAVENVLSDDEIRAVLEFIKSTWSDRERRYQAAATAREHKQSHDRTD